MLPTYYLLQVIICSGILFLYYHLALRNRLFHQWNRFYLLAAVVLSLILPAVDWKVDKTDETPVPALVTAISDVRSSMEVVAIEQESSFSPGDLAGPAYTIVSMSLLLLLAFSIGRIVREIRTRNSSRLGNVYFVDSDAPGTPFSFFKYIFWNNKIDIQSTTGKRIVRHEMVHVQEWHSADKIFMQLVLAACWINPFFWLVRRELRSIHEFIADQKSTDEEGSAALAAMILESSFGNKSGYITNQFFNSSIKRRIAMITKPHSKTSYFTRVLALPVIAFIALAFTIKAETPRHSEPTIQSDTELIQESTYTPVDTSVADTVPFKRTPVRIDFLKNEKVIIYFENGFEMSKWDWVVKDGYITQEEADKRIAELMNSKDPLIIYNGEEKPEHTKRSSDIFRKGAAETRILSPEEAVAKYGEKAKNGAIEIIAAVKEMPSPVFVKVETEASIDRAEWRKFLAGHILPISRELAEKEKYGHHTIMMKLLIEADGTVSEVSTVDDLNLGVGKELETILLRSPKWDPAIQNGKKVRSYVKQPITFVVTGDSDKGNGPVYTQVDKPAKIDPKDWRNFMDAVMHEVVKDSKYKGLKLTMSLNARLLIGIDGRVVEAVVDDEGLGVEKALEKALLSSPRWEPAQQNGENVRVYVNQPIHIILNGTESSLSNYPETDPEELKKMTIHQLLGVPPTAEIISCTIAIDQPNGDIIEVKNTGNEFLPASRRIIATAQKGLILTVDAILVKKPDGSPRKMPARVYKM